MGIYRFAFCFGWPYLCRYWRRFALGALLGVLFGLSNGGVLWATNTVLRRFGGEMMPAGKASAKQMSEWAESAAKVGAELQSRSMEVIDPWLPKAGREADWRQIAGGLGFLALFAGLRGMIGYLSTYCLTWASERVMNDLKCDALIKLNSLSLDYFNKETLGNMVTRINQDTAVIQRYLSLGLSDMIKEPITIAAAIGYLYTVDAKLTLISLVFFPACGIPIAILGRKVRKASSKGWEVGIQQLSNLIESLSNVRVTKAFGLEKFQENEFRDYARRWLTFNFRSTKAKELMNPIIEVLGSLSIGGMITFAICSGHSLTTLATFIIGFGLMMNPIKKLVGIGVLFQQTRFALERLRDFFAENPSVQDRAGARDLAPFSRGIEFCKVGFSYGDGPVLQDISFVLERGKKLGLAGESGCGKSTLLNLIFRFYDVSGGKILIDGVDLREVTMASLRAQMALVSQEALLFNRSVAENIAFGKIGAEREEIIQAAKLAHAHEFIEALPGGYDTEIGERGVRLSGGQRQRLTIARAFVRNAPILVLDEATASLDSESEAEVQSAIDALAENRTVICVAHRLSTLANTDRILVLSKGRVVEDGTFRSLLEAGGSFAEMARRQGISSQR